MKDYPFALITGTLEKMPVATQIPLNIDMRDDAKLFLTGHLMKNTDHHKAFENNSNVLVVFTGPHTYVSASWYVTKDLASTWNYMSVHAKGKIRFLDEEQTMKAIRDITNKYEGPDSPAAFNKLPTAYIDKLVKAIIAFEIEVVEVNNVWKLSQNHEEQTRSNIIEELYKRGDANSTAIADAMKLVSSSN